MRITFLIVFGYFLFAIPSSFGQSPDRKRAMAAYDDGIQYLVDGKIKRATKAVQLATTLDSTFLPGLRLLGVTLDLQNDYPGALEAYLRVIRADPDFSRLLYYNTGDVYLRSGLPREALTYFSRFKELQSRDLSDYGLVGQQEADTEREALAEELPQRILSAQLTSDSLNYTNASGLYNLGQPINSALNDYFPFFTNDLQGLLFTRQDRNGDEDLMEGERRKPEKDYRTTQFSSFNTRQPEGMCSLVRDGETIYFTLCHEADEVGGCDLYSGTLIDGKIAGVTALPAYINSPTWDSQAAISCDGRQLFFASTRPGGLGGSDLYSCYRQPDGSWSEPRNLGPGVNSPKDEEAPFLSNDGETLYFASMGHRGLGDQDIFFSRYDRRLERWTEALNLGPPINSPSRELGFHLTADGRSGFFASDRPGGLGKLDIYGFTLDEKLTGKEVTYVSGYVTDSLSGEAIIDQEVPVVGGDRFRTNYAGRFFICAAPDQELPLSVDRSDYLPYRGNFAIPTWDNSTPYRIDLRLTKKNYRKASTKIAKVAPETVPSAEVTKVLFAFESAFLSERQRDALDKFIGSVGAHRIISVIIAGFTDETGTSAYNLKLSQQRAASVRLYLATLGVDTDIMAVEGRGELAGATDKAANRRVEVELRLRE